MEGLMGESKRRKQRLDPNWGKFRSIDAIFEFCKEVLRPQTEEGKALLWLGVSHLYSIALENDTPGIAMYCRHQGPPGTENIWPQKSTVFMHPSFVALDALVNLKSFSFGIERTRHLIEKTDFTSHRIMGVSISAGAGDFLAVLPVAQIEKELKTSFTRAH